jgi:hypothetical protein
MDHAHAHSWCLANITVSSLFIVSRAIYYCMDLVRDCPVHAYVISPEVQIKVTGSAHFICTANCVGCHDFEIFFNTQKHYFAFELLFFIG